MSRKQLLPLPYLVQYRYIICCDALPPFVKRPKKKKVTGLEPFWLGLQYWSRLEGKACHVELRYPLILHTLFTYQYMYMNSIFFADLDVALYVCLCTCCTQAFFAFLLIAHDLRFYFIISSLFLFWIFNFLSHSNSKIWL